MHIYQTASTFLFYSFYQSLLISKQLQMTAEMKGQIVEYCKQINQRCELDYEDFTFRNLLTREWYLTILQMLFPHLEDKINQIKKIQGQAEAIDKIVTLIIELDQFQNIQIEATKIVDGDANQIFLLVQVFAALLQTALEQYEEDQIQKSENKESDNANANDDKLKYDQRQHKSQSDLSKPKSVQAIVNEFGKYQQQEDLQEKKHGQLFGKLNKKQETHNFQKGKNNKQVYKKFSQSNQDSNSHYFQQKNQQDINNVIAMSKKTNKKLKHKNPESSKNLLQGTNKKVLVTHPKSPITLKKARSSDAIALTNKIKEDIKKTKKKAQKAQSPKRATSPVNQQMKRKTIQCDYISKQHRKEKNQHKVLKDNKKDFSQKNQKNLQKILNWRQQKIKKQREQYEQSMKFKLQNKKQQYIKKINKLILDLERQKQIEQKKQFKQNLIRDNEKAVKKLTSLQQWYKNKLNMLKQNRRAKNDERMLIKSGHKQIIGQIEKYLKKQNEEKLIRMTDKYRNEQNNIDTDFEELREKIIRVYQKN